ncbi:adenosine 5'-monophosphoramidase HINT3-like [Osmia bicornis bicornis]|uniref:adenosine 5'-monophosphoramidase HINT3-like n=1 Tax=Osmia bicornis bicornis TaxID=1437191 RepID=UPI0010F5D287|nr:adenosine 5'-monophosphoramidase HINT3-like [Osmia bicornis bicornis]
MATHVDNCIFCKIINNNAPSEKVYEDDDMVCIKDIYPASTHHYLILPRRHIANAKELKPTDAELYDKMISTMHRMFEMQGLNPAETRTGFHWPPFNTVHHLHLHIISPISNMSIIKKVMFKPDSYWFVGVDYVKSHLQSNK